VAEGGWCKRCSSWWWFQHCHSFKTLSNSTLKFPLLFLSSRYDHPFHLLVASSLPVVGSIFLTQKDHAHLKLSQKIMHTRVCAKYGDSAIVPCRAVRSLHACVRACVCVRAYERPIYYDALLLAKFHEARTHSPRPFSPSLSNDPSIRLTR